MVRDPFFIVGFPRSGTTLLASMISRCGNVYIPAETHFFRSYIPDTKPLPVFQDEVERFSSYPRLRDLRVNPADFYVFENFISQDRRRLLSTALHILAKKNRRAVYGEKTPAHMLFLKDINAAFPGAKIIAIVRDGRDSVISNMKESWTRNNPYRLAAEWCYYNWHLKKARVDLKARLFVVKYEDLIEQPELVLRRLSEFLSVPLEINLVHNRENREDGALVPKWEAAWKAKALEAPDQKNSFKWRSYSDSELMKNITWIMSGYLKGYGYETESGKISWRILFLNILFLPHLYIYVRELLSMFRRIKSNF